jgi:hypothetical protein
MRTWWTGDGLVTRLLPGMPRTAWSVDAWLESEDGPTLVHLCQRDYYWDHGMCWLDSARIVVGGIGDDDLEMVASSRTDRRSPPPCSSQVSSSDSGRPQPSQPQLARRQPAA